MKPTSRLVVFDCDGTLVDGHQLIIHSVQRSFEREGLAVPSSSAIRDRVGLSLNDFVKGLAPGLEADQLTRMAVAYREDFASARLELGAVPLFPGITELLDLLLEQGILMGIATGKSRRGLLAVIESHGLERYFVTMQTADDAPSKPHPAMVEQAMAEAGVDAAATIMVGDSIYDILAARSANVLAVGVSWGSHDRERLLQAGASCVVDDVEGLTYALGPRST